MKDIFGMYKVAVNENNLCRADNARGPLGKRGESFFKEGHRAT